MKKYIAIATLLVASILIGFAVLPGHSADNTTTQPPTTQKGQPWPQMKQEMEARLAQTGSMMPPIKGQLVECPKLYVDDTGPNGVWVTTVIENNRGKTRTFFNPALAPGNAAETITPDDKPCVVYVVTSTDRTNWYPASCGQSFPESKTPRYFKMWTGEDRGAAIFAARDKAAEEDKAMVEKLKQHFKDSK